MRIHTYFPPHPDAPPVAGVRFHYSQRIDVRPLVPGEEGAVLVANRIIQRLNEGHTTLLLNGLGTANQHIPHFGNNRDAWYNLVWQVVKMVADEVTPEQLERVTTVWIDHARYPGRGAPSERVALGELSDEFLRLFPDARISMYGTPNSVVLWDWAANRTEFPEPGALPWLIGPGEWRGSGGPPTVAEFIHNLSWCLGQGFSDCMIWTDSRFHTRWKWQLIMQSLGAVHGFSLVYPQTQDVPDILVMGDLTFNEILERLTRKP